MSAEKRGKTTTPVSTVGREIQKPDLTRKRALKTAVGALAAQSTGKGAEGIQVMNERASRILDSRRNGHDGFTGLTTPEFNEDLHLTEKEPVIDEGLNISMYEYGSDEFMNLLSRSFGLGMDPLPSSDKIQESMLSANGEHSMRLLENGKADEIILFRENDRAKLREEFPEEILNRNFYEFIKDTYGVLADEETERFYNENINTASRFFNWYIDRALPQNKNALSQRNEVDPPPTSPAKLLHLLASENVSPELKHETQRIINAFFLSCEFTSRQWDIKLRTKLNDLNDVIDEYMLGGRKGDTSIETIVAIHNAETGRVINLVNGSTSSPNEGVLKFHQIRLRSLLEPLPASSNTKRSKKRDREIHEESETSPAQIYIDFDEKSIFSAMAKSIHKAKRRKDSGSKGEIVPVRDAVDLCRLVMVVSDSDKSKRDALVRRFIEVINDPRSSQFFGESEWVAKDDAAGRKGNAKNFNNRRLQVKPLDLKIPIEVQFFDMQSYLNNQLAVGKKMRGKYDGEAHELYELKKLGDIAPILFPANFYGELGEKLEQELDSRAATLRDRTLITR